MFSSFRLRVGAGLMVAVVGASAAAWSAERGRLPKVGEYNPEHETVEMFTAMDAGQIQVRLIHRNAMEGRVLIENKSDKPLNVRLPEAFAGVHVLAQGNVGGGFAGGIGQGTGGAFGGGGGAFGGGGAGLGGAGGGAGGGFFNVAPEQVGELPITSLCLDHGRPDPRPAMIYEVRRIESYTSNTAVHELIKSLGRGELNQRAAQAVAWHLNNNMSWEELAAKEIRRATGHRYPYFTQEELLLAQKICQYCQERAVQAEGVQQVRPIEVD